MFQAIGLNLLAINLVEVVRKVFTPKFPAPGEKKVVEADALKKKNQKEISISVYFIT